MGWLYICRQDATPSTRDLSISEDVDDLDTLPTVSDSGNYFEAQAQIAASFGMSASVIKQMNAGAYTYDQIETLLAQRRHVLDTIRKIKHPSTTSVPPTPKNVNRPSEQPEDVIASVGTTAAPAGQNLSTTALSVTPAGKPCNTRADSMAATPGAASAKSGASESPKKQLKPKEVCNYQVCHNCRPFFQDRLASNLAPMLSSEAPALAEIEHGMLPVHDAAVVSKLGLRRPLLPPPLRRSEESMDITMHQRDGTGYDSFGQDTSSDWTPTTTISSSEGDSDLSEKFDLSPCPGAGVCPVWSPAEGCAYENGFEDGRRDINHGYSGGHLHGLGIVDISHQVSGARQMPSIMSTPDLTPSKGSSISLPNPLTTPMTDDTYSTSCSCSLPERSSPQSNKSSDSSAGSEVEVEGGVALTEEAVETGTPDIAMDK